MQKMYLVSIQSWEVLATYDHRRKRIMVQNSTSRVEIIVEDIRVRVGNRIRELRQQKGLSQEDMAPLLGVHRTYLSSVERGKRNISLVNLEKIWCFFGITAEELFKGI